MVQKAEGAGLIHVTDQIQRSLDASEAHKRYKAELFSNVRDLFGNVQALFSKEADKISPVITPLEKGKRIISTKATRWVSLSEEGQGWEFSLRNQVPIIRIVNKDENDFRNEQYELVGRQKGSEKSHVINTFHRDGVKDAEGKEFDSLADIAETGRNVELIGRLLSLLHSD